MAARRCPVFPAPLGYRRVQPVEWRGPDRQRIQGSGDVALYRHYDARTHPRHTHQQLADRSYRATRSSYDLRWGDGARRPRFRHGHYAILADRGWHGLQLVRFDL